EDILARHDLKPPRTWTEVHQVVEALRGIRDQGSYSWQPLAQPLAKGWAAPLLLARSAAYLRDPRRYSDLFELGSMRPLIAEPPFVRGLGELLADEPDSKSVGRNKSAQFRQPTATSNLDPSLESVGRNKSPQFRQPTTISNLDLSPEGVFQSVRDGQAVLGVACFPELPSVGPTSDDTNDWAGIEFAILPGSLDTFHFADSQWHTEDQIRSASLVGATGYVGVVLRGTPRQRAAWNLLVRMSGKRWGSSLLADSGVAWPCRTSHLNDLRQWLPLPIQERALLSFRSSIVETYSDTLALVVPRLPHSEEFLSALDDHVRSAVRTNAEPQAELQKVAEEWNAILQSDDSIDWVSAYLRQLHVEDWP
ncbi:MAG TPA: hypothetical protein VIY86_07525, partial [Pirellulaceae bacterium]